MLFKSMFSPFGDSVLSFLIQKFSRFIRSCRFSLFRMASMMVNFASRLKEWLLSWKCFATDIALLDGFVATMVVES